MKAKTAIRVLALVLATVLLMTACTVNPGPNETKPGTTNAPTNPVNDPTKPSEDAPKELTTITLFPQSESTLSGKITGFRGEVLAKHGLEMEVWAYSADKLTGMLASGDFPDMMYIGDGGQELLETLIETDKIINFEDYKEYLPNIFGENPTNEYLLQNLDVVREQYSAGTGGLYILPFNTGLKSAYYNETGNFDRYTPKLKWDVYEKIGAPEVTDMWSLLDIAEQMLKAEPTDANGNKMYGMFLDNGFDAQYFGGLWLWYAWHGGDIKSTAYMAELDYENTEISYILDDDSSFKEGLRWHNEAYKRGLIDPDSVSTSRSDQAPKIDNGLAMLPGGSLPGWATQYYEVFPTDCTVYTSFVSNSVKPDNSIVIFKDSENIEACLEYINMMADTVENFRFSYGFEGDMWELNGNVATLSDKLIAWLQEHGNLNGYPMSDGSEFAIFNASSPLGSGTPLQGVTGENGEELPSSILSWPEAQAITSSNPNWDAWKKTMKADSLWDYAEKHNVTVLTSHAWEGVAYPTTDDLMSLTKSSLNQIIVPACWKMVYSETEAEFEAIWKQMVADAEALGAKDFYNWFVENFKPNK